MVLILDGNSEIGAHVWSDIGYSIRLSHLFSARAITNLILLHTCATCSELPSNISTMVLSGKSMYDLCTMTMYYDSPPQQCPRFLGRLQIDIPGVVHQLWRVFHADNNI